jgi:hypothetical protein
MFTARGAGLVNGEVAEAIPVLVEQVAQLRDQLLALPAAFGRAPVGFVEGAARGGDGGLDIVRGGVRRDAGDAAGPGIGDLVGAATLGAANFAVDVEFGFRKLGHVFSFLLISLILNIANSLKVRVPLPKRGGLGNPV